MIFNMSETNSGSNIQKLTCNFQGFLEPGEEDFAIFTDGQVICGGGVLTLEDDGPWDIEIPGLSSLLGTLNSICMITFTQDGANGTFWPWSTEDGDFIELSDQMNPENYYLAFSITTAHSWY